MPIKRNSQKLPGVALKKIALDLQTGTLVLDLEREGNLTLASQCNVYVALPVNFAAGEVSKTLSVASAGDAAFSAQEAFGIYLADAENAAFNYTATESIVAIPTVITVVSVSGATVIEGGEAVHTVTLSGTTTFPTILAFSIVPITASAIDYSVPPTFTNGVLYNAEAGIINVPVGISAFAVHLPTVDDSEDEINETYTIAVGGVGALGTITDNDTVAPTPITISSVSSQSVTEGGTLVYGVVLSGLTTVQTTFSFALSGNATSAVDFTASPTFTNGVTLGANQISVPAGVSSFAVNFATVIDAIGESSETLILTVGGVSGTGTITDLAAPTNGYMAIGANSDWLNDWETSGSVQRVNLAEGMRNWLVLSGGGSITYENFGSVQISDTATVIESVVVVRPRDYPDTNLAGHYEIWAQLESGSGGNLTFNGVELSNVTLTATLDNTFKKVAEFDYNPVGLAPADHNQTVRFYGTTNRLVKLYIGKPEHLAQWNAGNVWHPDFLARVSARSHWRSMNMFFASVTIEQSVAHRQLPSHIRKPRAPLEEYLDLCDRTGTKPYLNLPQAMDAGYAAFVGSTLNTWLTGRTTEVLVAQGNEMTFNAAVPWRQGLYWAASEGLTKYDSVIDTDGSILMTAHGLVNDDHIFTFTHTNDLEKTNLGSAYPFGNGADVQIQVKNANAFFINDGGSTVPKPANQTRVVWVKPPPAFDLIVANRAGKAAQHVRMAEGINAQLSAPNLAKVKYVIEGQSVNSGVIQGVLANIPSEKKAAVYHYASIAPYSNGVSYGSKVSTTSGSIELSLIGINSLHYKQTVHYALYPAASNPTNAHVVAGTGAVDFGVYTVPDSSFSVLPYAVVDTFAGVNGTAYKLITVMSIFANPSYLLSKGLFDDIDMQARIEVPFTLSASAQTLYGDMSLTDKLEFDKLAIKYAALDLEQHVAVIEGRPLFNYEDGSHYDSLQGYNVAPDTKIHFHDWLKNYLNNTAQGVEWMERLYHTYAVYAVGATYYKSGTLTPFCVDGNYITGKTMRSTMLDSYNKQIPRYSKLPKLGLSSLAVPVAPSAYPHNVYALLDDSGSNTLDSGAITYSIVGGDGLFSVSGGNLQITSAAAGLYSPPTLRKVIVKAETPKLSNYNEITVQFGEYQFVAFYTGGNVNIPSVNYQGDPPQMRLITAYTEINTATESGVTASVGGRYWSFSYDISAYVDIGSIAASETVSLKGKFFSSLALSQFGDYGVSLKAYSRVDNTLVANIGTTGWQVVFGTSTANAPESTLTFTNGATALNSVDHVFLLTFTSLGEITNTPHTYSVYNVYRVYE